MIDDKASIELTAARMKKARHDKGLTQVELAKKAGISETYYAQIQAFPSPRRSKLQSLLSKVSQRNIFKDAMAFIEDNNIKNLVVEKVDRHVNNLHDAVETHGWLMGMRDSNLESSTYRILYIYFPKVSV